MIFEEHECWSCGEIEESDGTPVGWIWVDVSWISPDHHRDRVIVCPECQQDLSWEDDDE